jgi:hypothetical protein
MLNLAALSGRGEAMAKQPPKIMARLRQRELKERAARTAEEQVPRLYGGMGDLVRGPQDAGMKEPLPKKRRS